MVMNRNLRIVLTFVGNWKHLQNEGITAQSGNVQYPNRIGLIFNTDGISPFKSSRLTIWPVVLAFSNLPPNVRMNKDNLVTVTIWAGQSKPPMDVLFESLLSMFGQLSSHGVTLRISALSIRVKFQPLFGCFDLVAKAPILNMHQFNGKHGCPACLNPGVWTTSRYYLPGTYPLRDNCSIKKAAEDAIKLREITNGIKGKSILTGVVDLMYGVPLDYMHCILEGVMKWMVEKWFASTSNGNAYYIGRFVKAVDCDLLQQCPPHDFSRVPRSIEKHRKYWKASEYRNFLLYYSLPILISVMPPLYLHHFALLVCSVHILLQSELSEDQIQAAEEMLNDYYKFLPELYGNKSCTLNAHSLIHLAAYVRKWGPLWTHSLFGFENLNGHIISMVHSKAEQLSFSIDVCQTLSNLADRLCEVEHESTVKYLAPLSSQFVQQRQNMFVIEKGVYSIGHLHSCSYSSAEVDAMHDVNVDPSQMLTFSKLYMHDTIFHTNGCKGKRDSSICCYKKDDDKSYGEIQKFCFSPPIVLLKPFKESASSLLKTIGSPCRDKLEMYAEVDLLSLFSVQVEDTLPICAVPISSILCKCVKVSCKDSDFFYIIQIPNNFEHH